MPINNSKKSVLGVRFRRQETTQDVIVSCCILHNMRKEFDKINKNYTLLEYRRQIEISGNIPQHDPNFRLQNYLVENYFH